MRKLQFWWNYLTDSGFRAYVHLRDIEEYHNFIQRQMEDQMRYQSKMLYPTEELLELENQK